MTILFRSKIPSLIIVLAVCIGVIIPAVGYTQHEVSSNMAMNIKEVTAFSQMSLNNYVAGVINESNYANFGFKSLEEAKTARVGKPLAVKLVGLEGLKSYKAGTGLEKMLIDGSTMWFPVTSDGQVRTKIEIVNKDGILVPGEFGGTESVAAVASAMKVLPELISKNNIEAPYSVTLVKVPALYAVFLYVNSGGKEYLIPAMLAPQRYELNEKKVYSADKVLSTLREYALKIESNMIM